MKSKQLANVLIKILGLSVCIHAVPNLIDGLFNLMRAKEGRILPEVFWFYPIPSAVLLAIGIFLIVKSRNVAECLFKNEED